MACWPPCRFCGSCASAGSRFPHWPDCPDIAEAVERIESGLEGRGRVLLRYSGTEPLCRGMVEGQDAERVRAYAKELAGIVGKALG